MSFGGGSSKKDTVVQSNSPWAPTIPGLEKVINDATSLYDAGGFNIPAYSGSGVAPTSPLTSQSWDMISKLAGDTSGIDAASGYNTRILNGDFSALDPILSKTRDMVNSNFESAGRYGGGANQRVLADSLGSTMAQAQQGAAALAPQLDAARYTAPQMLQTAGSQQEQQAQSEIADAMQKYYFNMNAPIQGLNNFQALLTGNYGGTSSTTTPQTKDYTPWSMGIGGGLGLASLGLGAYGAGLFG